MNWLPVLGLALTAGAPLPKEDPKKADAPPLVGSWLCDGITDGGRASDPALEALVLEFTQDGKIRVTKHGKPEPEGRFTADLKANPPALDFTLEPDGGLIRGIYLVDRDRLTLCFADEANGKRPTTFAAPAGTTLMLVTFRRVEAKKE